MDRVADRKQRTQNKCCGPCLPRAARGEDILRLAPAPGKPDRPRGKGARRADVQGAVSVDKTRGNEALS